MLTTKDIQSQQAYLTWTHNWYADLLLVRGDPKSPKLSRMFHQFMPKFKKFPIRRPNSPQRPARLVQIFIDLSPKLGWFGPRHTSQKRNVNCYIEHRNELKVKTNWLLSKNSHVMIAGNGLSCQRVYNSSLAVKSVQCVTNLHHHHHQFIIIN